MVTIPTWAIQSTPEYFSRYYYTDEEMMSLAIHLSDKNITEGTGGPFGAAIFERHGPTESQPNGYCTLVSIGMNRVVPLENSTLHGEMVAIQLAQRKLGLVLFNSHISILPGTRSTFSSYISYHTSYLRTLCRSGVSHHTSSTTHHSFLISTTECQPKAKAGACNIIAHKIITTVCFTKLRCNIVVVLILIRDNPISPSSRALPWSNPIKIGCNNIIIVWCR